MDNTPAEHDAISEPQAPVSTPSDQGVAVNSGGGDYAAVPEVKQRAPFDRTLIVSFAILTLSIALYYFLRYYVVEKYDLKFLFDRPKKSAAAGTGTKTPELKTISQWVFAIFAMLLVLGGGFASLVLFCAAPFVAEVRSWLKRLFALPKRPIPALKLFDVVAIFAFFASITSAFFLGGYIFFRFKTQGERIGLHLIANDSSMALAIGVAICLARLRAGRGAERGFWTAWNSEGIEPAQPLWKDALLGLGCFFVTRWMLFVTGYAYRTFVGLPDDHFIVAPISAHPPLWAMGAIIFAGTFGAAFFEETLFRGMLYNSLRRFIDRRLAAGIAATVFAIAHVDQDLLSLFLLAVFMTWLYDRTGRLFASMVFHFANNAFAVAQLLLWYY